MIHSDVHAIQTFKRHRCPHGMFLTSPDTERDMNQAEADTRERGYFTNRLQFPTSVSWTAWLQAFPMLHAARYKYPNLRHSLITATIVALAVLKATSGNGIHSADGGTGKQC